MNKCATCEGVMGQDDPYVYSHGDYFHHPQCPKEALDRVTLREFRNYLTGCCSAEYLKDSEEDVVDCDCPSHHAIYYVEHYVRLVS